MSLDKLKRTLHREFTRNPAKSCALLALLPVAAYFIGPLVWKGSSSKGGVGSPLVQLAVADGVATSPVAVTASLPRWQEVAQWIAADVRMRPAGVSSTRDPFWPIAVVEQEDPEEVKQVKQAPSAASLRPEDCGLELTATIVGSSKRLATINGRLYAENTPVPFGNPSGTVELVTAENVFVLKTVAKNFVVLERHGEAFQLRLQRGTEK